MTMKTIYGKFIKRILLSILIAHSSMVSFAATYYVSNAGDDANSGLNEELAWETLTKVNSATFSAGDQILFKRGDTFYGSLIISQSGSSGNPITFGAYGTGTNPVITGFTEVASWTDSGSNIWESTNAVSTLSNCNMVVINSTNTPMGRTPNSGYYYYQSHSNNYHITSNNLTGTPNWTGAELAFNPDNWETKRCPITAQSTSTLTFTQPESFSIRQNDLKFIIQNDIRTLDQQNEWYYNPSTKKISIYSTSEPAGVMVSSVENLVSLTNKSYITIRDLKFTGANSRAITMDNADYVTISNCDIKYIGKDGISGGYYVGTSSGLTIDSCSISNTNNGAIGLPYTFTNATIRNNTIDSSGMIYGASAVYIKGTNQSSVLYGINVHASGLTVEHNTITNTGYCGILFYEGSTTIQYNFVQNFNQINHDGGGIYTWNGSNVSHSGMIVKYNIIINDTTVKEPGHLLSGDVGLYFDDFSNGIEVAYNSTEVPLGIGIFLHNAHDMSVHHNTVFNSLNCLNFSGTRGDLTNDSITYNTLIAKSSNQVVYRVDPAENIITDITADYNVLDRPIDSDNIFECVIRTPSFGHPYYSLSEWQSYSGQDANSHKCPVSITSESDLQFEYNASDSVKTVPLSKPMIDVKWTKYASQLTLQPYSSIILIKDPNPTYVSSNLKEAVPIDVYPNPSQGKVTVRFSDLPDIGSRIEILDISGRKVASRIITGAVEEFNLDQLSSGIYMVKSTLGSDLSITKLILEK